MNKYFFTILFFLMFLMMTLSAYGEKQLLDRGKVEALFSKYEKGDGDALEELISMGNKIIPLILARLESRQQSVRAAALDVLGTLDLEDDRILNNDEVIQAMLNAIDGSESDEVVVDMALSWLDGWNDPKGYLRPEKASPQMIEALLMQLWQGNSRAARVLGRIGDSTLRPALEPYASQKGNVGDLTRQALAKLGDERYLREIVVELNLEGPQRSNAMEKLAYIGNKSTVRMIARFLYDLGAPPPEIGPRDRVVYLPYRYMAAWALGQIVDNPPIKKDVGLLSEQDIETWRAWWEAHQNEYP